MMQKIPFDASPAAPGKEMVSLCLLNHVSQELTELLQSLSSSNTVSSDHLLMTTTPTFCYSTSFATSTPRGLEDPVHDKTHTFV